MNPNNQRRLETRWEQNHIFIFTVFLSCLLAVFVCLSRWSRCFSIDDDDDTNSKCIGDDSLRSTAGTLEVEVTWYPITLISGDYDAHGVRPSFRPGEDRTGLRELGCGREGVSVNSCSPRARGAPSGEKRDTLGQPADDAGPYIISVHRDECLTNIV